MFPVIQLNAKETIVTVSSSKPLSSILSEDELQHSDSIKVYGYLSGNDFLVLQKMTVNYKLRHIDLYNTTNTGIGSNAFEGSPLKSIILPRECTSIGYLSFANCGNLEMIDLGNKLSSMNNGALRCCNKLRQITLPATLSYIGTQCMDYTPFTDIYCLGAKPATASANAWTCYSTCTVHVPLNSKSAYEYANGWMRFHNIVEESMSAIRTISLNVEGNGVVMINDIAVDSYYKYENETSLKFKFIPEDGYNLGSVLINGIDFTSKLSNNEMTYQKASDDMIINVIFSIEKKYLSIKSADNGSIAQEIEKGKSYSFVITPSEGWDIESVSFNGENVTSQLEDNRYTTPAISSDSELNIVYKQEGNTNAKSLKSENNVKVFASYGKLTIENAETSTNLSVYSSSGSIVVSEPIGVGTTAIDLPTNNIYVVKVGKETFKVSM